MKKIIKVFIIITLIIFLLISLMVNNDKKYIKTITNNIKDNTSIKNIEYLNVYDNYYIVIDETALYLFDNKYLELLKIDKYLLCDNKNNYDIIYDDEKVMYLKQKYKGNKLVYEYYDIYSCKLINKIVVGD